MNPNFSTAYSDIFKEIVNQLNLRKGLLVRRTLRIYLPFLLIACVCFVVSLFLFTPSGLHYAAIIDSWGDIMIYLLIAVIALPLVHFIIASAVFAIERNIWIISFFDGKTLTPQQSWKIAKKLAVRIFPLYLRVFLRYLAIPFLVAFLSVVVVAQVVAPVDVRLAVVFYILFLLCVFCVYAYILHIKFRYLIFLFLDLDNFEQYSSEKILASNKELNNKLKNTDLKERLALEFGVFSVSSAISFVANSFKNIAVSLLPEKSREVVRGAAGTFIAGLESQIESYSLVIGNYVIYRTIKIKFLGQVVSEHGNVYELEK